MDYLNLWAYTHDLCQQPGIAETVEMGRIRRHHYFSEESVNSTRVVAIGPELAFNEHHRRGMLP